MIISFGWTKDFLPPKGNKDTTRRMWKESYFESWRRAWDDNRLIHDAVSKQLCFGGQYIGKIKLLECPYRQPIHEMNHDELIREGGMVATVDEFIDKYFGGDRDLEPVIIRFKFTPLVLPKPKQLSLLDIAS